MTNATEIRRMRRMLKYPNQCDRCRCESNEGDVIAGKWICACCMESMACDIAEARDREAGS